MGKGERSSRSARAWTGLIRASHRDRRRPRADPRNPNENGSPHLESLKLGAAQEILRGLPDFPISRPHQEISEGLSGPAKGPNRMVTQSPEFHSEPGGRGPTETVR